MNSITEQRFIDRLLQALATLPQNQPRGFVPPLPAREHVASTAPISPATN